ncbi:lytic murein transglycosylase B [Guyparkeria hydrothermalis]|uniref:lytic murein transglycosylase B n=1 Tax=Guyparkeria hydrothermalis TaxID=923 RepID=UPI0020202FD4|nr:lytic murein transglycosylase B [Guyparkeria hydrothermalis]MCL7745252.1 lytic murein transglycosylase B [Guyparkeria hydrothermalis]
MKDALGRGFSRFRSGGRTLLFSLLGWSALTGSLPAAAGYLERDEVQAFLDRAVDETGVERGQIEQWLGSAVYQQKIIDAITRPAESKTWGEYRPIFLTEKRIDGGVAFMEENAELLEEVAATYGVSPYVIAAIIGVETYYGRLTGGYRVIDALATLGFDYPKRGEFFRGQLIEFIRLAGEENLDMDRAEGSYAGAMGMPQFIPSSYRHYAVDGDGDGDRDLWDSRHDVFASVANYFVEHGWGQGEPVMFEVDINDADVDDLLNRIRDLEPKTTLGELRERGVSVPDDAPVPDDFDVMLFTLTDGDDVSYHVGLNNFYVITRYNHSVLYATAVWQLAQAIQRRRESEAG